MIVGISGKKQSGKDTLAEMLSDRFFNGEGHIIPFAAPVKMFCMEKYGG